MIHRLAIFASGGGSNAEKILHYFKDHPSIQVAMIVSNNSAAGVAKHAGEFNVPFYIHQKDETGTEAFLNLLKKHQITAIILAGYLKKIPASLIDAFPDLILNIHPALLPKFGGKGMYGMYVHQAVADARESQSGMTIHLVNRQYDEGRQLFQAICPVFPGDDAKAIAARVLALEHQYYPKVIENYLLQSHS